jgi:fluoroquinolone transport system permease protein
MTGMLRYGRALAAIDGRSIARDPLLRWMVALPVALALALRFAGPALAVRLGETVGFDLMPHYTAVVGFSLLMLAPMLVGAVVGFLLLDQRDDDTLTALRVTPMPLPAYLAYRLAVPTLLSTAVAAALLPLAGLGGLDAAGLALAALGAAGMAPLFALLLAAFATNKVQGFAMMKAMGLLGVPPLAAYFLAPHWQWAFAAAPTYWPARAYWTLLAGGAAAVPIAVSLLYAAVLCALLLRRFQRRLSR